MSTKRKLPLQESFEISEAQYNALKMKKKEQNGILSPEDTNEFKRLSSKVRSQRNRLKNSSKYHETNLKDAAIKRQKKTCKQTLTEDVFTQEDLRLIAEDWDKGELTEKDYQEICDFLNDDGMNGGRKRRRRTKRRLRLRLGPRPRPRKYNQSS